MKPTRGIVLEASVACDFSHVSLEDAFEVIKKYINENDISILQMPYLHVGIESDLLKVIDLSRTYSLNTKFKKDYDECEWSLHMLNEKDYSHIVYWSPGS